MPLKEDTKPNQTRYELNSIIIFYKDSFGIK